MQGGIKQQKDFRRRIGGLSAGQRQVLEKLLRGGERTSPLTPAQQRLWFLEQLSPNSPWYNVDLAFRLDLDPRDAIDIDAMRGALNEIVRRHEPLRASFSASDGQPVQMIHPELDIPFPVIDLGGLPEADRETEVMRIALEEAQQPFDLSQPPLLRASLLRLSEQSFVFLLTMHHIVADGWSVHIFSEEFTRLYEAFRAGDPSPLSDLPIQFSDYVQWQRKRLETKEAELQLAWWKRRLQGAPTLELPTDHPRPAVPTYRGARQLLSVSQSLMRRLEALSRREETTLFVTLLAAFQTLLHRYTGQPEIVLGTPIAGRNHANAETLIGCFINTLVLRTDLSGNPTFREALRRTRETVVEALERQDVPFERIVDGLNVPRDLVRNPLFQITFQLFQTPGPAGRGSVPLVTQKGTTQMDLAIDLFQSNSGLSGTIEYSTELFEPSTIERIMGHFQVLIEGIADDPGQRLSALPLLTHRERRQVLTEWNIGPRTCQDLRDLVTVQALVEQQAAKTPHAIALIAEGQQITYEELDRHSNRFAHYLEGIGAVPGSLLGFSVDRSPMAVIAILGTLKAGCALVQFDRNLPPDRLAFLLEDARPAEFFTTERLTEEWPRIGAQPADAIRSDVSPDACAYVIYTSGSTGAPKGVSIPHGALSNHMLWSQQDLPLVPADRMLHKYSLSFDVSIFEIFAPLIAGAAMVIVRPGAQSDSAHLAELIASHRVTALDVVPSQLLALLDEPFFHRCSSLRRITCGGEAMPVDVARACLEQLPRVELYNLYGPTETTITATSWRCTPEGVSHSVPIGRPIPNTEVYVLDRHFNPVPVGVPGELYIGGAGLAIGYLNRPEFTSESFVPNPFSTQAGARLYRTGDLVRYRPDGNLEHLGRMDDQIKVRGFRIEPGEVEAVLASHASVQSCAAALDGKGGLAAWVVPAALPEIWPSVGEHLRYDSVLYHAMTNDERRNASYRAAIAKLVPGRTVVDIGTGADALLARYSIEAGAKKVYAIEMLPESFDRAARVLAQHGLESRIHLIYGDATRVELPEKVDVCVSELMGMIASSEGAATILNQVRRFLKPGGVMIPYRCSTQIVAVSLPDSLAREPRFTEISGPYVERVFAQMGRQFDIRVCINHVPKSCVLSNSGVFEALDFTDKVPEQFQCGIGLTITKAGRLDGFLLWLTLDTAPGEHLDVFNDRTRWLPVFFPAFSPGMEVQAGDEIRAVCTGRPAAGTIMPGYRITGHLQRVAGRTDFDFVSPHGNSEFRSNDFYRALLADGYQSRYALSSGSVDSRALEEHLKGKLPEYMIPSTFVPVAELPRTASGKLDRRKLAVPARTRAIEEPLAPRTPAERAVADIWADLLGLDTVGLDQNFFDLGGHSLLAVRMISRVRKLLNVDAPVVTVFQHPTVRLLANALPRGGEAQ
jgi:amino acid adenylation domain-containing protein